MPFTWCPTTKSQVDAKPVKIRINEVLESCREYLTTHEWQQTPILTAYVNVDPTDQDNRRERPAWLIELKNQAKELESTLDQDKLKRRETQNKWSNTEEVLTDYLTNRQVLGRSVAFFTDHVDHLAVDLPLPTPTRLYYGLPQLKHLLFNLDQYKKYAVVLMSGDEVRTLEVFLTRTTSDLRVETGLELTRRLGRFAHAHTRESRGDEFDRRFAKQVAAGLSEYYPGDPDFERLVLGGNAKQAHAVRNSLDAAIREKVVGIEPIDFNSPNTEVAEYIKSVADRHEFEHDLAVVDDLVARCTRGRTAVLERQGVEAAVRKGNAKTLVLPYPIDSDTFDSLVASATIAGVEIEFVYQEAADRLHEHGGIGARLYYSEG